MRQLVVQVPRGHGAEVLRVAQQHEATNLARADADGPDGPLDVVTAHLSNARLDGFLQAVEPLPEVRIVLVPRGVIALRPPADEAPDQVVDVTPRAPFEVYFAGLQSIGSWSSALAYAAAGGIVAWIGLYTNRSYLLVGAMLIAPFAGPAMTVAMGSARGDLELVWRGVSRYAATIAVTIAVSLAVTLIVGMQGPTDFMERTTELSPVALLLPLVAGAAGAMHLCRSERDSLVSGAAVGMLVAASLAPPAGALGMAVALGEWSMAANVVFLLVLQLVGIHLAGAIVFRVYGLGPEGARYDRGRKGVFPVALALTTLAIAGLLALQLGDPPELQRAGRARQAESAVRQVIEASGVARPLQVEARFAHVDWSDEPALLTVVHVVPEPGAPPEAQLRQDLVGRVQRRLLAEGFEVEPYVDLTVVERPPGSS